MKKTALLLLLALCVSTLAGCSEGTAETTAAAEETTAAAADTTVAAAEEMTEAGTTDVDAINAIVEALEIVEPDSLGTVAKLGDYKGLELTAAEHVTISDEEVEEYIAENILVNYTEEVTDAIREGDTANIDYEGKKDGVAFDGGTSTGYDLEIGSGSFIDGFESGLIGHKAGETVDLNLTFPEDYASEELAGQDVVFTVKINSVTRPSELTDAIAKEADETCNTAAEFRASVKKMLQDDQDLTEKQELYYNAVEAVMENSDITPSEEAITYTVNSYVNNYANSVASMYGIDFGTMLSYYGMSYEDFVGYYEEYAVDSVKQRLALEEIAKKENISVTDEDREAFAESYGYTVEELKETVGESLAEKLVLEDKANKLIVDNAKVTYEAAE